MESLIIKSGSFSLQRTPIIKNENLRAWDAADELLINTVLDDYAESLQHPTLLINDAFGALAVALHEFNVDSWSDSFISQLATQRNLRNNGLPENSGLIPATENLTKNYTLVLIKIPKTLSLLEDQLYRLKDKLNPDTVIIAAGMSKHIHTSTLDLFEKIIGTTKTSRATKKARLVFSENDKKTDTESPYPKRIDDPATKLTLSNHANVFSKDKLDIGTRFFIEQLEKIPPSNHIVDLGCGNGALGITAKRHQARAKISFVDESFNAIKSAQESYALNTSELALTDSHFQISNILEQFNVNVFKEKVDLILCNPPFHQAHSMGDHIAWEMFKQSREILQTDGELWIVGNRHLGYHIKLKKVFGNCRSIASNKKFVVLAATKANRLLRKNAKK